MKLTDQVVSLELAKRLKALGVGQDSHFVWFDMDGEMEIVEKLPTMPPQDGICEWYAAFTVAELGERLPDHFKSPKDGYVNLIMRQVDEWQIVSYYSGDEKVYETSNKLEAESRGLMLEYLITNNLITL